jgi:hypothetical protein
MIAEKPVAQLAPAAASALSVEEQIGQRAYQLFTSSGDASTATT